MSDPVSLRGNHPLLNFHEDYPVLFGRFKTGEHLFQYMKARTEYDAEWIRTAPTAKEAKARGRQVALRPDWEEVKWAVMVAVILLKLTEVGRQDIRGRLLATGKRPIREARRDPDWGYPGKNLMGRALRSARRVLRTSAGYVERRMW